MSQVESLNLIANYCAPILNKHLYYTNILRCYLLNILGFMGLCEA